MTALRRLEQGGYTFQLDGDAIAYEYCPPDAGPPLDERPPLTQWAVTEWAAELFAQLPPRETLQAILWARAEWLRVYDEWGAALARGEDEPEGNVAYWRRLCDLAVAARWACYNGGPVDPGAAGWAALVTRPPA